MYAALFLKKYISHVKLHEYLRSCKISFALYMVINEVLAPGMMMIGVLETRLLPGGVTASLA